MKENFKPTITTITVSSPIRKSPENTINIISRTTSEREFGKICSNKYNFKF